MTVNKHYTVWCDGTKQLRNPYTHEVVNETAPCGEWITGDSATDARSEASYAGWRIGRSLRDCDYCPRCASTCGARP